MAKPVAKTPLHQSMPLLSRLLLMPLDGYQSSSSTMVELRSEVRNMSREEFDELVALANSNHVIVRSMEVFLDMMQAAKDDTRAAWAQSALIAERARITTALAFLEEICSAFEYEKYGVAVIKSLDHWPDIGSDLTYIQMPARESSQDSWCVVSELRLLHGAGVIAWQGNGTFSFRDCQRLLRFTSPPGSNRRTGEHCFAPDRAHAESDDRQPSIQGSVGI